MKNFQRLTRRKILERGKVKEASWPEKAHKLSCGNQQNSTGVSRSPFGQSRVVESGIVT